MRWAALPGTTRLTGFEFGGTVSAEESGKRKPVLKPPA